MKRIIGHIKQAANHPLAKGSAIVFAGTMLANASAYAYHLVVGRLLGPARYGELAALLSLSYILNVFVMMLQTVVTKFTAEKIAQQKSPLVRSLGIRLTWAILISGGIGLVLLLGIAPPVASFLHISESVVLYYLFAGVVFSLVGVVYTSILAGMQHFTEGMVLMNVTAILRLAAGALFASFGVVSALAANTGAVLVSTAIALWAVRSIIFTKEPVKDFPLVPMFKTSMATFLAILGVSVLNSQDVIMVKHFLPSLETGWYGALSTMGKIIFFASNSVAYVLLPIVSSRSARGQTSTKLIYLSITIVSGISLAITAGFFAVPDFSLGLLYGSSFVAAAPYLGMFGIFSALYTISYTVVMALLGSGKSAVWLILIAAAIIQDGLLVLFHQDIPTIITVNILLSSVLIAVLLLYYRHASKDH